MGRQEITELIGERQRAAYRALTPNEKKDIWLEKFNTLINNSTNPIERELFEEYKDFIINFDFIRLTDEDITYLYTIIERGRSELSWELPFEVITFGTLDFYDPTKTEYNIFRRVPRSLTEAPLPSNDVPDCNCRWGYCGARDVFECKEVECDIELGCGLVFMQDCTKLCTMF